MSKALKPTWIANSFLVRASDVGVSDMTPMKIQKMIYYLNGWYLASQGEPIIGELFDAWPYGPVLSSLYHQFKRFGIKTITEYAVDYHPEENEYKSYVISTKMFQFYEVFDAVWDRYKNYSDIQLSSMAHKSGTPWEMARNRGDPYLDDNEIAEYFQKLTVVTTT